VPTQATLRRSKRDERAAAAPTANDVISRTIHSALEGDGTAASASAALAPFPSRAYVADIDQPYIDETLIGKQVFI
jgi:hypothetical protein